LPAKKRAQRFFFPKKWLKVSSQKMENGKIRRALFLRAAEPTRHFIL